MRADSLTNLACFGGRTGRVCDGTVRFGLMSLGEGCRVVGLRVGDDGSDADESDVQASSSFEVLEKACQSAQSIKT